MKNNFDSLKEIERNYPLETLINGNTKECIQVLKDIFKNGLVKWGSEQLNEIKNHEQTAHKYEYIINKVRQ